VKTNHIIVLLTLQTVAFFALVVGLVYYVYQQQAPAATMVQAVEVDDGDASVEEWIPVERMDYLVGPWVSITGGVTGDLTVSVSQGAPGGTDLTTGPWRLAIEQPGQPFVVCGVYTHLQAAESPELPWRLAHCQGLGEDPHAVLPTRAGFYRVPRWPYVRFVLGDYLELDLAQVQ
jgi:hypothetical protein